MIQTVKMAFMSRHEILAAQEACGVLKIARQTLYIWIEQGKIKPWRQMGGREACFFLKKDVEKAKGITKLGGLLLWRQN